MTSLWVVKMASEKAFFDLVSMVEKEDERRRRRMSRIAKSLVLISRRRAALSKIAVMAASGNLDISSCLAWMATWPRIPRWWQQPRERTNWWSDEVLQRWDNDMWVSNFRMSKETLFDLASILRPELERGESRFRSPIPVEKRVALTIWWLSSPLMYRKAASRFEVGISTAAEIAIEVCLAMEKLLLRKTIQLGNYHTIMDGFQRLGFPHCIGAIDGTHISVCPPLGRREEYINRKQGFSIVLQAITDHSGRLIDIEVGNCGRSHDSHIFNNSAICEVMDEGCFVPGNPTLHVHDVAIPPLILGDGAYPIRKWLMTPYRGELTPDKLAYNTAHCKARCVVERCFARLKSRWGCLSGRLTVKEENFISVVTACAILHNICETRGEVLDPDVEPPAKIVLPAFSNNIGGHSRNHKKEGQAVRSAVTSIILGR
ncbi:putative nuclease HARBI1 [Sceloporus undulatus]|uniref:putative nuclease HARBI1 n=1 Tax=Sceloporus undulatus TaxID=8520 RepID=UPI001C4B874E|nr:putative nuclease HARBI1 [Sceloporus undulatus]